MTLLSTAIGSGTNAARPAFGNAGRLYFSTDINGGTLYRDSGAAWVQVALGVTEVPGGGIPYTLFDAKGDLLAGTASDTGAKVTVGTNGDILQADSAQSTGLKWNAPYTAWPSMQNEFKAWPPLIPNDVDLDAYSHWWHKVGTPSTAPTYVDVAGESITTTYRDCIKVVAAATSDGMKQTWTYADEPRVKSGRVMSVLLAIWSVSGVSVTAKLVNSDTTHTDASAVTAAAWTLVEIPNHTLAGTSCDLQITAAASGTFYVVPLGACIGSRALALPPRGLVHKRKTTGATVESLSGQSSKAVADVDLTSDSHPLAAMVDLSISLAEFSSGEQYRYYTRPNGSSAAVTGDVPTNKARAIGLDASLMINQFWEICDDSQIIETALVRDLGAGTILLCVLFLLGWQEWA